MDMVLLGMVGSLVVGLMGAVIVDLHTRSGPDDRGVFNPASDVSEAADETLDVCSSDGGGGWSGGCGSGGCGSS